MATKKSTKWLERVAQATVKLPKKGGQGVMVPGGYVITAAHCIGWAGDGEMVLGDFFIEDVETTEGVKFRMQVRSAATRSLMSPCLARPMTSRLSFKTISTAMLGFGEHIRGPSPRINLRLGIV